MRVRVNRCVTACVFVCVTACAFLCLCLSVYMTDVRMRACVLLQICVLAESYSVH